MTKSETIAREVTETQAVRARALDVAGVALVAIAENIDATLAAAHLATLIGRRIARGADFETARETVANAAAAAA